VVDTDDNAVVAQLEEWRSNLAQLADRLRSEIRAKQAELARIDERLSLIGRLIQVDTEGTPPAAARPYPNVDPPVSGTAPATTGSELEDAVEAILRESGAPQHISAIRSQLLARGVPIPGRGDEANIIVRLRRLNSRFTRTARGTYGLAVWGVAEMTSQRRGRRRAGR
jgi:hypothetical protein